METLKPILHHDTTEGDGYQECDKEIRSANDAKLKN